MSPLFARHHRFFVALGLGLAIGIAAFPLPLIHRVLLGSNLFFLLYLILTLRFANSLTQADLRRHAERADEGLPFILMIAVAAVLLSVWAIFAQLNNMKAAGELGVLLALGSVPLGWATLHMVLAFHYARIWYARDGEIEDQGGLDFPGCDAPGMWEFLYQSFVIGLCAQVADVNVTTTRMRRMVLAHSIGAFFYNTVLIALAVNAAASFGQ
ncbi:MAG: DUF1345 domain-containing protein [Paracoccus sp. (in: a-proteobacteria)]|nr:DUF1345 domain-containing protein [Paracoccus sp. (in: a-proteobacteria)]